MLFRELSLSGVSLIQLDQHADDRGFFARSFCEKEFTARGLVSSFSQSSISFNRRAGTVRGMHYSLSPHAETKLVRCTAGAIHDVLIDLRPRSPTFLQSIAIELTAENRDALYVPVGLAHGFQTLCDSSEVLYMIDVPHVPGAARGVRWNDPAISVTWPNPITVISDRDRTLPDLDQSALPS